MAKPCSGVAGSSTGTFAKEPNPARVLLGLGGDGARIVGHEQHAAAARAHVVQRHERIGSDIESHLLAGEQHPRAAVGRAGQHLERRLLVGGPFHMHVLGHAAACSFATVSTSSDDGVPG